MVAAHPGIFMFDEPMSALDAYLKSALEQNMLDLFDVCNRTVLYVSHDIDEACPPVPAHLRDARRAC